MYQKRCISFTVGLCIDISISLVKLQRHEWFENLKLKSDLDFSVIRALKEIELVTLNIEELQMLEEFCFVLVKQGLSSCMVIDSKQMDTLPQLQCHGHCQQTAQGCMVIGAVHCYW